MTKRCPIKSTKWAETWTECKEDGCAWWVSDLNFTTDPVTDNGCCAMREIASLLGYLRSLNNDY